MNEIINQIFSQLFIRQLYFSDFVFSLAADHRFGRLIYGIFYQKLGLRMKNRKEFTIPLFSEKEKLADDDQRYR